MSSNLTSYAKSIRQKRGFKCITYEPPSSYLWAAIFLWDELVTVNQMSAKIKLEHWCENISAALFWGYILNANVLLSFLHNCLQHLVKILIDGPVWRSCGVVIINLQP